MTSTKVRTESELAKNCLGFIRDIAEIWDNTEGFAKQDNRIVQLGYMKTASGVLLPKKYLDYKVLFQHYETELLRTYCILAEQIIRHSRIPIVEFSYRTLQEIGLTRADALLSASVSLENREKIKTLVVVIDLLTSTDSELYSFGERLLEDKKSLLTPSQLQTIEKLRRKKPDQDNTGDIKEARQIINDAFAGVKGLIERPSFITAKSNLASLNSIWSHMLHGDIFAIQSVISEETTKAESHFDRSYAIVLITSANIIFRLISRFQKYQTRGDELLQQIDEVWGQFQARFYKRWEGEAI